MPDDDFETEFEALLDKHAANADEWRKSGRMVAIDILRDKLEALEIEEQSDGDDGPAEDD